MKFQFLQDFSLKMKSFITHVSIIFTIGIFLACQSNVPEDLLFDSQPTSLIFVKSTENRTINLTTPHSLGANNLFSLTPISPNGKLKQLTNLTAGAVADPEISYDGLKVLFSMKENRNSRWHIYEMNVDGSNRRQVTQGNLYDDLDPAYLPNGKILFSSNRSRQIRDEYERHRVEVLHTMNADGSNIQCISFNNSDDFDPIVLRDGRVAWTRWDHHGTQNRFPIFFTDPDGQSTFVLFGPHRNSMKNFFHPREINNGNLVAVLSNNVLHDTGPLAILNSTRTTGDPFKNGDYQIIANGNFKFPFPLPDNRIVVSHSPNENVNNFGLYTLNKDGSNLTSLYDDPDTHEFDAVVVTPRPKPPVKKENIDKTADTGVFLCQDVYFRQQNDGQARPDKSIQEIKEVMVIEGIGVPENERNMKIGHTNFERKRVLGRAPVQSDGSFRIRVPKNIPISFNTLDSLGRAVVIKRNWIYARPGETFENCTGCHGPRGKKSNPNSIAAQTAPTNLSVPIAQREIIAFGNAIEPIITQKCLPCHNSVRTDANLDLSLTTTGNFSLAYDNLMQRTAINGQRFVNVSSPPFARRSYLVDVLLGLGEDRQGKGVHPAGAEVLTPDEIKKFITWIDLGGQYY